MKICGEKKADLEFPNVRGKAILAQRPAGVKES